MSTSALNNRKKGNPETEPLQDPESGDITIQEASKNENDNKRSEPDKSLILLFTLAAALAMLIFAAPSSVKKRRAKLLNKHLHQGVLLVEDKRNKLAKMYTQLTSTINEEEILMHKEQIKQLHSDVSSKQGEIDKLTKDINENKKMLEEVMKQKQKMKDDTSNFCYDCIFLEKYKMTCADRLNYIVEKYGDSEVDTKEALVKENPKCKKKSN